MNFENIYLIKTKFGELFIGQYIVDEFRNTANANFTTKEYLKEAYTIQVIPTAQQSFNIMLLPVFVPISKECVDLDVTDCILTKIKPNDDLKNQYIAARTNIVVANTPKSNLVGA